MKTALAFVAILNYILFASCDPPPLTEDEINDIVYSMPSKFCGSQLNISMKKYCRPEIKAIFNQRKKRSLNFDIGHNSLDDIVDFYGDQSDGGNLGMEWLPKYYESRMFKRHGLTITQACCKLPCAIETLVAYCPNRNF